MYETLEIVRDGAVATVWMNRPEVHNAFDERLIDELTRACVELDGDASVRVVVLGGRGRNFSAGADLNWMRRAANNSVDENRRDARRLAEMLRVLAHMSKPTIARVQGAALGGGTGLTAACDMAVAARDAVFSTSEVRFGIIPSAISPYVLRAIGPRQALRYFQSAERIPAERALAIGLVHEVAASEELDRVVAALAAELMSGGPNALAAAKALVRDIAGRPIDAAIGEETAERIARQRATDEAREGISAFLEKRPPSWRP
ncbi:MAG: enoyl-CoA hydratase/isomerase family protein [Rhodocyclaceae bacterium]|jgi:methylglutaconyl-CoA hydratase|nr:enoyl-CoA hydratase/isomerase family protein [Rhodocyclaceae bacterium]MBK9312070.1 enoyl-CoA hydratase/isomerase family protein [Rhodocyclaceae bacterium]MBK9956268.1 enoyl-CoA hydratase/isomerase family protein [Rhodocyclaceae bacterium]